MFGVNVTDSGLVLYYAGFQLYCLDKYNKNDWAAGFCLAF